MCVPVIVISDSDINVDSIDVAPCSVEAVPIQNKQYLVMIKLLNRKKIRLIKKK